MKQLFSFICALGATFIWGTTFVAQDQGMDVIGPLTFNSVRFFMGFIVLMPIALVFEIRNQSAEKLLARSSLYHLIGIGIFLFLGSILQQYSLLYTDVANAAFFTITYVMIVPLLCLFLYSKKVHWSIWPSIVACITGGYFLSEFSNLSVRLGDSLVVLGALFWSLHIIFISKLLLQYNFPFVMAATQSLIVAIISLFFALIFEEISLNNILIEINEILYAGILSSGLAFLLQIYGQKHISPAPAAIIFSLEGVFAAIAAWVILGQILNINQIFGCFFILVGVLTSQLSPILFTSIRK